MIINEFDSLVILSPFVWDGLWINPHYMANYFSTKVPVLYVEPTPPWSPQDNNFSMAGILHAYGPRPMRQAGPGLFIYTPKRLPFGRCAKIADWNARLFGRDLRSCMRALRFEKPLVCASFFDGCLEKLHHMGGRSFIYYCLDHFSKEEEKELSCRAAAVFSVNKAIAAEKKCLNSHSYWMPTGVDVLSYSASSAQSEPNDIARIPHPRVGLTATFTHYVDYGLLLYLAMARSDISLVLIGPIFSGRGGPDERDRTLIEDLKSCTNVHWLGAKPTNELPPYVQGFDAGIIPFKDEDFNRGRDPLKLYQYLAAGVRMVSTPLTAFETEPPGVLFASEQEDFLAALDRTLWEKPDDLLKGQIAKFAKSADWSNRFKIMEEALGDVFPRGAKPDKPPA